MKKDIIAFMVKVKFAKATALLAEMKSAQTIEHGTSVAKEYHEAMQSVRGMMLKHKELLGLSDDDITNALAEVTPTRKEMK